jgi:hypothetical protein
VLRQLISEDFHEGLLFVLFLGLELFLRWVYDLLRRGGFLCWLLGIGVEVVVDEFEDEILVIVQGLNVAVQFEEMGGDLVLKVVELDNFLNLLANQVELALCLHQLTQVVPPCSSSSA